MLSLSVREALEQSLTQLRKGQSTTGLDISFEGGHSTDGMTFELSITIQWQAEILYSPVLPEASCYSASNEYLTLKDKVQKVRFSLLGHSVAIYSPSFAVLVLSSFKSNPLLSLKSTIHSAKLWKLLLTANQKLTQKNGHTLFIITLEKYVFCQLSRIEISYSTLCYLSL